MGVGVVYDSLSQAYAEVSVLVRETEKTLTKMNFFATFGQRESEAFFHPLSLNFSGRALYASCGARRKIAEDECKRRERIMVYAFAGDDARLDRVPAPYTKAFGYAFCLAFRRHKKKKKDRRELRR